MQVQRDPSGYWKMAHDPYCLEEKIISDLEAIMKKDPLLEEFDVIPVTEAKNRSPVIHISHNLGIEVWCIKTVFMYCYENSFKLEPLWKKEYLRLERYTKAALLLNANITTLWNIRKRLITNHFLGVDCDFLLTKLVLSQKPKCFEALSHRRWLLQQASSSNPHWVETELSLCDRLSSRMKCNYHAWSHRQCVFSQAIKQQGFSLTTWASEFEVSDVWTKCHLSDHSGWHYRKFLLDQFRKNLDNIEQHMDVARKLWSNATGTTTSTQLYMELLNEELQKNEDLILSFNAHETLWYYRRFLLQAGTINHSENLFLEKCRNSNQSNCKKAAATNFDGVQMRYIEHHRRWLSDFCL
ncbi:hypothetical protein OUZ56_031917 [Daphnia magna]|uniref:Protein prenyltransferase alpha subunit repeat-containing protein 1 n=1 Tax=Daphnia magna TaxID=35525 RepID=A0ABQ9ZVM8_9CRUS|nr:hypothetical protein OUZ56_031917 [Daphnia magna]